jgi:hypothetical protein
MADAIFPDDPFVPAVALKADSRFRALPVAEQVEKIRTELKNRDSGFDGALTHENEGCGEEQLNITD